MTAENRNYEKKGKAGLLFSYGIIVYGQEKQGQYIITYNSFIEKYWLEYL